MEFWIRSIRRTVLTGSIILAGVIFLWARFTISETGLRYVRLDEVYAFVAIGFLYFTLLATPLTRAFPGLPFRAVYTKARRALGVSAFLFGLLHASISLFVLFGGPANFFLLPSAVRLAASLGFFALIILALLAATSINFMVRLLGRWWKPLHRLVYLAAILILVHGSLLGAQLGNPRHPVTLTVYAALIFLLALEGLRIWQFLRKRFFSEFPSPPSGTLSSIP